MSIREDVVDTQSFNVLQSLVADYFFNKALSKRFVVSRTFIDVLLQFSPSYGSNLVKNVLTHYYFIELLVDFDHEHGVRGDFECLRPRQNLMDVVSTYFIYIKCILY